MSTHVTTEPAESPTVSGASSEIRAGALRNKSVPSGLKLMRGAMKKTVEDWASDKGHANREAWKFAAAKAHAMWVESAEVTEEQYDAAVNAACNLSLSGY